jgi:energy-converting hydrogenase B subunit D
VIVLQVVSLALVASGAVAVVLVRDLARQALVNALYGLALAVLFLVLQAPDVALSEVVVGAIAVPLVLLAAIRRVGRRT